MKGARTEAPTSPGPPRPALRDDAAVDALRRQVRGHVIEPEAAPLLADLAQVFGLEQHLFQADVVVGGVLVDDAAAGGQDEPDQGPEQPDAPHGSSSPACPGPG